jgi:transglutaminase-like putative cysteine protease
VRQTAEKERIPIALWFSLRAHWVFGLIPLFFLTEIYRLAVAGAAVAFLAGAVLDWTEAPRRRWHKAASLLLAGGAAAAAADLTLGSGDLLTSVSLLVLGVQTVKFLLPKTRRDGWQLCAISFLEFLAAAATTTEIWFAVFLFLFLGLSAGAMWALQVEESAEAGGTTFSRAHPGFAVLLLLLSTVGGFLMATLLFVVTPRIGIGHFIRRMGPRTGFTGFSDAISLRDVTAVKIDRRVVARIEFSGLAGEVLPSELYLRGATYARFDGTRWHRPESRLESVPNAGLAYFLPSLAVGPMVSADIFLEPVGNSALFVYPGTVSIEGILGDLRTDGAGNYLLPEGDEAVRYRIYFPAEKSVRWYRTAHPAGSFLTMPSDSGRIRELAMRLTSGASSDAERAGLAKRFFLSGFRYSLVDVASSVEDFLFRKRSGYCEHYAAALTLLLRAAGVPARVAAGYLGGEWNDVGKYLIVRQSDAHAWTEAWIDGRWVTLDATPPMGEDSPFFSRTGRIGMYLDWAVQRWCKYVLNYSLETQMKAVSGGVFAMRQAGGQLREGIRKEAGNIVRVAAACMLAAAMFLFAWRMFGGAPLPYRRGTKKGDPPLPWPYARLLRRLSAAGHRRSAGTPLEEMVMEAADRKTELLPDAARFLALYHRDRFGSRPLASGESAEASRLADILRRELV